MCVAWYVFDEYLSTIIKEHVLVCWWIAYMRVFHKKALLVWNDQECERWDIMPNCVLSPFSLSPHVVILMFDGMFSVYYSTKCSNLNMSVSRPAFEVSDTRSNTYASSWILDYFPKANIWRYTSSFKLVAWHIVECLK